MFFLADFRRFTRRSPVKSWDLATAETFAYSLKPVVAIRDEVLRRVERLREAQNL